MANVLINFSETRGYATKLRLGWALVGGVAKKDDFIGANINRCARLCDIARPFGIVIERDDFSSLPQNAPYNFVQQVRKLDKEDFEEFIRKYKNGKVTKAKAEADMK